MKNDRHEFISNLINKYPYREEEIVAALDKMKFYLETVGISEEEAIVDICRIGSITRESGLTVGNALRSIYSRLTGEYLIGLGFDMTKNTHEILEELAIYYKGLKSSDERSKFLVNVGGMFNFSRTGALFENR